MPIEYEQLKYQKYSKSNCPKCFEPYPNFLRGLVQSDWRRIFRMKYCAVICHRCREIVGWEKPDKKLGGTE